MIRLIVTASSMLAFGLLAHAQQPAPHKTPPKIPQCQLVFFRPGPGWQKDVPIMQQKGIKEHIQHMTKLREEGRFIMGGGLGAAEGELSEVTSLMLLKAATPAEAQALLAAGPACESELFEIAQIRPFQLTGGAAVVAWMQAQQSAAQATTPAAASSAGPKPAGTQ